MKSKGDGEITVNKDDFQKLLICAVRYALPCQSYITAVMSGLVKKYMEKVDWRTLYQIRVDILDQKLTYGLDVGWIDGLNGPIDVLVNDCFKKRFGLTDTKQVDYCRYCNSITKIEMDRDGKRYCARCGELR